MRVRLGSWVVCVLATVALSACDKRDGSYLCEDLLCEEGNRSCVSLGDDGYACGNCLSGFVEEDGRCVVQEVPPPKTCQDLQCESQQRACSEGSDDADAVCGACVDGFYDKSGTCTAWTVCDASEGELESVPPTATADRVCSPCGAGRYMLDGECAELKVCDESLEYESEAPTATSDRVCSTLSECGVDQFEVFPPTETSDRFCTDCDWVMEFWSPTLGAQGECAPRSEVCPEGLQGSLYGNCDEPCEVGFFNDGTYSECQPYTDCSELDGVAIGTPSAVADNECFGGLHTMVRVPKGSYRIGLNGQLEMTFSRDFYMATYELTNRDYEQLGFESNRVNCNLDECPRISLSWTQAIEIANRASDLAGLPRCFSEDWELIGGETVYDCEGYRLPTAAEWEYAARAGTLENTYGPLDQIAWYVENSSATPHPVGQKLPNAFGLYDIMGNAMEWVYDSFFSLTDGAYTDYQERVDGENRCMVRGGSYSSMESDMDFKRVHTYADFTMTVSTAGVRLVRTIHEN